MNGRYESSFVIKAERNALTINIREKGWT